MRKLIYIFAAVCLLLRAGVSEAEQVYFGDLSLSFVKGHAKRVVNKKLKTVLTFDREGRLISKTVNGKPLESVIERDSRGMPVKVSSKSQVLGLGHDIHRFADDGALLEYRRNSADGNLILRRVYTYDSDRNCTGYMELMRGEEMPAVIDDSDNRRVLFKTLESDSHGNVLKRQICFFLLDAVEEYEIEYY